MKKVLVIAPHPDDEVLGVGGTIAKFASKGNEIYVVVVTKGYPPLFSEDMVIRGRQEALKAHELLGVKKTFFLDKFPAAKLDTVPHSEINAELANIIHMLKPDILFIPFNGDIHLDHQQVFLSSLVAIRPNGCGFSPQSVYAYETLSETNWNAPYLTPGFIPNVFIDISDFLDKKIQAMKSYQSQVKPFPNERSLESLHALATLRGSTVGVKAAEAFVLIREIK
jgi:LmbE family N-acetylglucosaminyl deacetylase